MSKKSSILFCSKISSHSSKLSIFNGEKQVDKIISTNQSHGRYHNFQTKKALGSVDCKIWRDSIND